MKLLFKQILEIQLIPGKKMDALKMNYILLLQIILIGCASPSNKNDITQGNSHIIENTARFESFVLSYTPKQIELDKDINKGLENYDLNKLFAEASLQKQKRWISIIFLKVYLFHLKNANQSFDLYSMRNGKAKFLMDKYIELFNLTLEEWLSSGVIYDMVMKDKNLKRDVAIKRILDAIQDKSKKIKSGEPWK